MSISHCLTNLYLNILWAITATNYFSCIGAIFGILKYSANMSQIQEKNCQLWACLQVKNLAHNLVSSSILQNCTETMCIHTTFCRKNQIKGLNAFDILTTTNIFYLSPHTFQLIQQASDFCPRIGQGLYSHSCANQWWICYHRVCP